MLDLEYTEVGGLLYPKLETEVEEIENNLTKYGIYMNINVKCIGTAFDR